MSFSGGDGIDYASYIDSEDGIYAQLGATQIDNENGDAEYYEVTNDGFGNSDYLYDVENIIGSTYSNDTASYSDATSGVSVTIQSVGADEQLPADKSNILIGVENIIGSDYDDTIEFRSFTESPLVLSIGLNITMDAEGVATVVDTSDNTT